jgi:inner membrane protein
MCLTAYDGRMASAIAHFVVGAALALPAAKSRWIRRVLPGWAVPVTAGLIAVAPDLDTYLVMPFGVERGTFFAHRGFFHSALFLAVFCGLAAEVVARRLPWRAMAWLGAVWAGAAVTHPLLDMLTDGGPGVMLLYPLTEARMFFPWRPIHVSPLSIARFFERAGPILRSEAPFCAAAVVAGLAGLRRRHFQQ